MTEATGATSGRGWYHGWNIIIVCIFAAMAGNGLTINSFSLFLKSWSADLHAPVSSFTLAIAACGILCSIMAPFAGTVIDRLPARPVFIVGLIVVALFDFGISFAQAPWQIMGLYGALGAVGLILTTTMPANALVSRWFVRRLGLALGLTAFGLGMGGVIMPPLIGALMPALGWRMIWRLAGAFVVIVLLPLVILVMRERPGERDGSYYLTADGDTAPRPHGHGAHGGGDSSVTMGTILTNRNFWVVVAAFIPMMGVYGGISQNIAPIAASRGIGTTSAGLMLAGLNLGMLAGTLLGGMASDRLGNRLPLAILTLATALAGVMVGFGQNILVVGVGAILAGCGNAFWPVISATFAREFGPGAVGRCLGMVTLFLPGTAFLPFIVAKIQEATGSYGPALSALAAMSLLGAVVCFLFMREKPRGAAAAGGDVAPDAGIPNGLATQHD
jgi:sugar phosphate permease